MSALKEEHLESMHAGSRSSSSKPLGSSIRASAEDISLMHHSQAAQQLRSHRDQAAPISAKQYNASMLAATVTLFGPGECGQSLGTYNCVHLRSQMCVI